jgi:hypothetical protein
MEETAWLIWSNELQGMPGKWRDAAGQGYMQCLGTLFPNEEDPLKCFKQRNNLIWFVFQTSSSAAEREWSKLHLTPPGQQQCKALGNPGLLGPLTIATRKSAVHLEQILDAAEPKCIQAQLLYGEPWKLGQGWTFRRLTPGTEASPDRDENSANLWFSCKEAHTLAPSPLL